MALERDAEAALASECDAFSRHLAGLPADFYLTSKYIEAHALRAVEAPGGHRADERLLVRLATLSPFLTRIADAYASVWARKGLLRRKLILVLALLEVRAGTASVVDAPSAGSLAGLFARLAWRSAAFVVGAAIGSIVLGPLMLAVRAFDRRQLQLRHSAS
jgi:hypothetical protein